MNTDQISRATQEAIEFLQVRARHHGGRISDSDIDDAAEFAVPENDDESVDIRCKIADRLMDVAEDMACARAAR